MVRWLTLALTRPGQTRARGRGSPMAEPDGQIAGEALEAAILDTLVEPKQAQILELVIKVLAVPDVVKRICISRPVRRAIAAGRRQGVARPAERGQGESHIANHTTGTHSASGKMNKPNSRDTSQSRRFLPLQEVANLFVLAVPADNSITIDTKTQSFYLFSTSSAAAHILSFSSSFCS